MRCSASLLFSLFNLLGGGLAFGQTVIAPDEALQQVGQKVRVRFQVNGVGRAGKNGVDVSLTSLESYKQDGCLIIRLSPLVQKSFSKHNVGPQKRFRNRQVEVEGTVIALKPGGLVRAAIFVTSPEQIRFVDSQSPPVSGTAPQMSANSNGDKGIPLIAPEKSRQLIGKKVRMQLVVESIGRAGKSQILNTEDSFDAPGNVQVVIPEAVVLEYSKAGIDHAGRHFLKQKIEVIGKLEQRSPGGVSVPSIILQSPADVKFVLQSTRKSLPVAEILNREVELYLRNGDRFANVVIAHIEAGDQPGSIRSLRGSIRNARSVSYKAAAIEDVLVDGVPLDLSYNRQDRTLFVDKDKRAARLAKAEATELRVLSKGRQLLPRLTVDEQDEWIVKNRAFAKKVQRHFAELPVRVIESEFFLIVTDIPSSEAQNYFPYLDQLYHLMCKAFGIPAGRNIWNGKCIVCAFQNRRDFIRLEVEVLKITKGNVTGSGGLCHPDIDGQVVISLFRKELAARFAYVLVHETSHGIVSRFISNVRIPSWLNEGMAVWIGAQVVRADQTLERAQRNSIVLLRQQQTLSGFFQAKTTDGDLYGAAATMVDMLIQSDKRGFRQFFVDIKEGYSQEIALQRAFKRSFQDLAAEYGRRIGIPELKP